MARRVCCCDRRSCGRCASGLLAVLLLLGLTPTGYRWARSGTLGLLHRPDDRCLQHTLDGFVPLAAPSAAGYSFEQLLAAARRRVPPRSDCAVQLVTVATRPSVYLQRFQLSAALNGYRPPTVLGAGAEWRGFIGTKLRLVLEYLETQPPGEIVVVSDIDVMFQRGPCELLAGYHAAATQWAPLVPSPPLLTAAEPFCNVRDLYTDRLPLRV